MLKTQSFTYGTTTLASPNPTSNFRYPDTADGDILIETLCTYLLDAESNTQSTGTLLYLHKNTVHYRLNKIRSVLKCDLAQMPATLAVYKAAVVYRILKGI